MPGICCVRTTLDEEMFTTAGMARFTTGANVESGIWSPVAASAVEANNGTLCVL